MRNQKIENGKSASPGFSLAYQKGVKASVKYKVIYRHKDTYSISEMCRFFGVSRSGYYGFVNKMDVPAKDLSLAQIIQQCQEECHNTYGYRRVHIWLERQGIHVKVNIKMLKNRNIKMYRAPIFIPPAVLPKRIVFL